MTSSEPVHTESEAHPWTVDVPDHPARQDSPEYVAARQKMNEIAGQATGLIYGPGPYQDHHGGALWLQDAQGWFMVRNLAGIEWSAQFCADPAKVDLLRQNAKRLYDLLAPEIKQQLDPNGLLDTPIQDAAGVARWTDSIFNAGVPLQPSFHIGVLPGGTSTASDSTASNGTSTASDVTATPADGTATPADGTATPADGSAPSPSPSGGPSTGQEPAGVHHYPTPIV